LGNWGLFSANLRVTFGILWRNPPFWLFFDVVSQGVAISYQFSQGDAIGLDYGRPSACWLCRDVDSAPKLGKCIELEKSVMISDVGHNPWRVNATQWQHTLAQRHRPGKKNRMVCTIFIRTIFLPELSLRTKRLCNNWLAVSKCLMKQSHDWSTVRNIAFVWCFLGWDCFGVHKTIIKTLIPVERRAMTGSESESAVMLFVIFP